MVRVRAQVIGELHDDVPPAVIAQTVQIYTSEQDGIIAIRIFGTHSGAQERMVHFTEDNESFLGVFEETFCALIPLDFLNVRELIFLIDNQPQALEEYLGNANN